MYRSVVLIVILCSVRGDKENVEENHIDEIADKLVRVLEKRLNEWDVDVRDGLVEDEDQCRFTYRNDSIVKTQQSIDNGATFIKSPSVRTRESCEEICCDIGNCNLAVFKDKYGETSCYLFNCGAPSKCLFTSLPGYVTIEIPKRQNPSYRHEADLESLAATSSTSTTVPTTTTTTTTSTTTTTQAPTTSTTVPSTTQPPHVQPVPLFGECESHKDCAGSSTECLAGYCVCQEGYHAQEGACHPDKAEKEEKPLTTENQDKTDSKQIPQKPLDTETTAAESTSESEQGKPSKTAPSSPSSSSLSIYSQPDRSQSSKAAPSSSSSSSVYSQADRSKSSSSLYTQPDISRPSESQLTELKPQEQNQFSTDNNNRPNNQATEAKSDTVDNDINDNSNNDIDTDNKVVNAISDVGEVVAVRTDDNNDDEDDNDSSDDSDVESQHLDTSVGSSVMRQSQSAVVALALGLVLTVLLLIFVGCRLRNMKRRLRKGRPLNSNEADYLINGMYL